MNKIKAAALNDEQQEAECERMMALVEQGRRRSARAGSEHHQRFIRGGDLRRWPPGDTTPPADHRIDVGRGVGPICERICRP